MNDLMSILLPFGYLLRITVISLIDKISNFLYLI